MDLNWFPGHMMRAIRDVEDKIKLIDLVIEIVDARIPFSSSNPIIAKLCNNKPRLIVMNKNDLADLGTTQKWVETFKANHQHVLVLDSKHDKVKKQVVDAILTVLAAKIARDKVRGIRNPKLKIMILGIPNVGKSTFINNLVQRNAAITGNKPGVTKGQQWLKVSEQIDLLDTPGILWPKMNKNVVAYKLAMANAINQQILPMDELTDYILNWFRVYNPEFLRRHFHNSLATHELWTPEICYAWFLNLGSNLNGHDDDTRCERARWQFLNQIWNHEFGRLSFETPDEVKSYESIWKTTSK